MSQSTRLQNVNFHKFQLFNFHQGILFQKYTFVKVHLYQSTRLQISTFTNFNFSTFTKVYFSKSTLLLKYTCAKVHVYKISTFTNFNFSQSPVFANVELFQTNLQNWNVFFRNENEMVCQITVHIDKVIHQEWTSFGVKVFKLHMDVIWTRKSLTSALGCDKPYLWP